MARNPPAKSRTCWRKLVGITMKAKMAGVPRQPQSYQLPARRARSAGMGYGVTKDVTSACRDGTKVYLVNTSHVM